MTRDAVHASSMNPTTALKLRGTEAAARSLRVRLQMVNARRASDFEAAFSEIRREKPDGLVALLDVGAQ
jgi:hypothetical protein